jgi:hypothetical protein
VHGDIGRVGDAISLWRATLRIIRQNLAWASGYNLVLVPVAMLDVIPPTLAAGHGLQLGDGGGQRAETAPLASRSGAGEGNRATRGAPDRGRQTPLTGH